MSTARGTANSRYRAATVDNTPNPFTVAMVGALDFARGLAASGRLGGRQVGMSGNAYDGRSFRGELGPHQSFRGWHPPISGMLPGAPMSLPLTGAPDPSTGLLAASR